ncbi:hypothetical protein YH63_009755 [Afipia massiliensis]|uniref:Uncharacterized protein n=1 Tax=Afipia massiliensis TaxID=211460 RepID=A0A4U6BMU3_9BRAD|nr:hypothetical protein YH63_009755 [Afipia massiliensis]
MSLISRIIGTTERTPLPDVMIRARINALCSRTAAKLATGNAETDAAFARVRRWRWFFLATTGLFGHADGTEWGISHYRMTRA